MSSKISLDRNYKEEISLRLVNFRALGIQLQELLIASCSFDT